jgi:hypothetical protein
VFSEIASSKLYFNIQQLYVASPASPFVYAGGVGFGWLLNNGPAALFYLALAVWTANSNLLAGLFIVILLIVLTAILTGISFYVANLMQGERDVYTLGSLFTFVIFLLSPVYYPITAMPAIVQPFTFIFPATGCAILAQWSLGILSVAPWVLELSVLNIAAYLAVAYIAVKYAKWRED